MSLLMRKRTILAKVETTYGTDITPTGAANAILIKNLNVVPIEMNLASRDIVRPYLGNFDQVVASKYVKVDFEVEVAGAGTAGTAPGYGQLLRACALSETILAAPSTGTATAGSTNSVTLAAGASAVDNTYNGMLISITGGTGAGQTGIIKSYVGSTKVATMSANWTVTTDATSVYTIAAQVVYQPISAAFESNTIYFNIDGVLHKILGARGTVSANLQAQAIPTFKFSFTGLYQAVTDTAAPTVVLTGFQTPLAVNNINTTGVSVLGYAGAVLSDVSIDLANTVTFRSLVGGSEQVVLTDRKAVGSLTIESTTVAAKDWWTAVAAATTGALGITHGTVAGNKVSFNAPKIQLTKPGYQDKDGIAMTQFSMTMMPVSGNDEVTINVL